MTRAEPAFQIWVDADACPRAVKEILYRASARKQIPLILVANVPLRPPESPLIRTLVVAAGTDRADDEIVRRVQPGDLVISADIPLAAEVVQKGAFCLDPRGTLHTPDTMHERLSIRNLMEEVRGTRESFGGPAAFSHRDRQAFANQLDKFLRGARG
ncbi:MAG: YaiI/YqxD family protein [Candidatus Sericytochromatia bacterium]